jgi:hypothetical protein
MLYGLEQPFSLQILTNSDFKFGDLFIFQAIAQNWWIMKNFSLKNIYEKEGERYSPWPTLSSKTWK